MQTFGRYLHTKRDQNELLFMVLKQLAREQLTLERGRSNSKASAAAHAKEPARRRVRPATDESDDVDGASGDASARSIPQPAEEGAEITVSIDEPAFLHKVHTHLSTILPLQFFTLLLLLALLDFHVGGTSKRTYMQQSILGWRQFLLKARSRRSHCLSLTATALYDNLLLKIKMRQAWSRRV